VGNYAFSVGIFVRPGITINHKLKTPLGFVSFDPQITRKDELSDVPGICRNFEKMLAANVAVGAYQGPQRHP
jgi:hypothetical protein